jgi:hypothetical protein
MDKSVKGDKDGESSFHIWDFYPTKILSYFLFWKYRPEVIATDDAVIEPVVGLLMQ